MNVRHSDKTLERMEADAQEGGGFGHEIARAFRRKMQVIRAAVSERDFYALKGLRYEKLQGKRKHERSMRLNDQFRLILQIDKDKAGNVVVIISIEDYH